MSYYILISSAIAIPAFFYFLRNSFNNPQHTQLSIENMKSILILGGSFAGVSTAHRIFKKNPDVKITIVSPTDTFYWNLAGPRAIVPGGFADEKLFAPIVPGFKQYGDRFEYVQGTAEALDIANKSVTVKTASGEKAYSYDHVILATGSRTKGDVPYKQKGSTEETKAALHDFQARVKKATSIVVAGGGSTGVETAGELGFEYGTKKQITLVRASPVILARSTNKITRSQAAPRFSKAHLHPSPERRSANSQPSRSPSSSRPKSNRTPCSPPARRSSRFPTARKSRPICICRPPVSSRTPNTSLPRSSTKTALFSSTSSSTSRARPTLGPWEISQACRGRSL